MLKCNQLYGFGAKRSAAGPSSLLTGLMAFWKMEENGAAARVDATGNGLDLTAHGTPAAVAGVINNAAQLSHGGNGEYLDQGSINLLNKSLSICGWFKTHGTIVSNQVVMGQYSGGGHGFFFYVHATTHNYYLFMELTADNAGDGVNSGISADTQNGNWLFAALLLNDSTLGYRLLLRTQSANLCDVAGTAGGHITSASFSFELAGYVNGNNVQEADFDAWGVWNRVLTDPEIDELYNAGAGKEYPFS